MSVCGISKFGLNKNKYIERYINTKVDLDRAIPFGFSSSIDKEGNQKIYTKGKRNIEKDLPFEADSIYRMASQSKFMGLTGFMKLVDSGKIKLSDKISKYLPSFNIDNMGVIKTYPTPPSIKTLMNPFSTKTGSNIIKVSHNNHGLYSDQYISVEWSNGSLDIASNKIGNIGGINGYEVFNIHKIFDVTPNSYSIKTKNPATKTEITGNFVQIRLVTGEVSRSITLSPDKYLINPKVNTYYYTLEPLNRALTILDILTHGLGWTYYAYSVLYMSFGYFSNPEKQNIQAGVWNELDLPIGLPLDYYSGDITDWANTSSKIPLLYQPGEDWSYGPQLSLLGAIIKSVDGRDAETYMKEELWDPLGMKDTGFFIYDNDPNYDDKKHRMCQLYVNMPTLVIKFIGDIIPFPCIYEAETSTYNGKRRLTFIDSGMFTTVNDYMKFMKMYLDNGKNSDGGVVLTQSTIDLITTFATSKDVSNLSTISGYSSGLSISISSGANSEINRSKLLGSIKWGLGVGTMEGCKSIKNIYRNNNNNNNNDNNDNNKLTLTWAGVLGTRFLIDFCQGVAYNVGTNVIGPPAGTFDSDLIELNYKPMCKTDYDMIITNLIL